MTSETQNLGVLERWWAINLALWKARVYWLLHPSTRIHTESRWIEQRGKKDNYGFPLYDEEITYVAIFQRKPEPRIVREYYGKAKGRGHIEFTDAQLELVRQVGNDILRSPMLPSEPLGDLMVERLGQVGAESRPA